jgi:hypothetical protein
MNAIDIATGENVKRAAESGVRIEGVDLVSRRDVDVDGEIRGLREEKACIQKKATEKKDGSEITHKKLLVRRES